VEHANTERHHIEHRPRPGLGIACRGQYFEPGYGFSFDFWGWIYRAGRDGTWVNASTGSSGDIN
jgi:hypothetical protein